MDKREIARKIVEIMTEEELESFIDSFAQSKGTEKPSGDGWWYDPEVNDYCLGPFKTHEEFWAALNAED